MTTSIKILISRHVAVDLALRDSADKFFNFIEALEQSIVTIDFSGVKSISRSFAHQYHLRKAASKKMIRELHVPENVKKMFEIVSEPRRKISLVHLNSKEAICL